MINIDHVSFQYSGAERENLQDFILQIPKGECVVLTGESGCGKTCVTRLINALIPHFYEGEMSGTVSIDGIDTRDIQPHELSDKIGSSRFLPLIIFPVVSRESRSVSSCKQEYSIRPKTRSPTR